MITANWRIKCNVECPYCDEIIDIYGQIKDAFEWLPAPGHSEDVEHEINCTKCNREFIIQNIEH